MRDDDRTRRKPSSSSQWAVLNERDQWVMKQIDEMRQEARDARRLSERMYDELRSFSNDSTQFAQQLASVSREIHGLREIFTEKIKDQRVNFEEKLESHRKNVQRQIYGLRMRIEGEDGGGGLEKRVRHVETVAKLNAAKLALVAGGTGTVMAGLYAALQAMGLTG